MKMLDTTTLKVRDTDCGRNLAGFGTPRLWEVPEVIHSYKNAFGEQIVAVFTATMKYTAEGFVLSMSGGTDLQYFAPSEWADVYAVPFAEYDGRYDELHVAGFGGKLADVRDRGTGVAIVTTEVMRSTHLDYLGEDYDDL